ncbi:MAG: LysR substrate-binding domain-containing protein, partial [Planctomycetia bacterium]
TDAGRLFLLRTKQIVSLVDDAKAEIADDGAGGRLRLTAIPTVAPFLLPTVLHSFAVAHPLAEVRLHEETTDAALRRLQNGEADLLVAALPIPNKYLEVEPLFDEELFLVLPAGHPLVDVQPLTARELEPYPFVLLDEAHCLSETVAAFCRRQSVQPVAVERTSQLATVQELVALGHGVSIVPASACRLDFGSRRVYRRFVVDPPTRRVAMAWNPYRYQSRLMERFKDHLRTSWKPGTS